MKSTVIYSEKCFEGRASEKIALRKCKGWRFLNEIDVTNAWLYCQFVSRTSVEFSNNVVTYFILASLYIFSFFFRSPLFLLLFIKEKKRKKVISVIVLFACPKRTSHAMLRWQAKKTPAIDYGPIAGISSVHLQYIVNSEFYLLSSPLIYRA